LRGGRVPAQPCSKGTSAYGTSTLACL
jgi:hypothetical protein